MSRLLHSLGQRNATVRCLSQISRSQPVGGKLPRLQPNHLRPLLHNRINRLRIDLSIASTRFPIARFPLRHCPCRSWPRHPCIETLHRPGCEVNGIILFAASGFCPSEMNGKRGEGRPASRWSIARPEVRRFHCAGGTRPKGDHQDCPVTQIA